MSARSIVELPGDLNGDHEVYLNGVLQQAYVDFDVEGADTRVQPAAAEVTRRADPRSMFPWSVALAGSRAAVGAPVIGRAEGWGPVLGCWCAPLACHGDVLVRPANAQ